MNHNNNTQSEESPSKLPAGYAIQYGGQFEAQEKASRQITLLSGLAIIGIFILLYIALKSARSSFLMTALVTGVGLIPLALGKGQPGKESQQPLAVVILGGIVTSTFMNMIVIPALYLKFANVDERVKNERPVLRDKATVAGD